MSDPARFFAEIRSILKEVSLSQKEDREQTKELKQQMQETDRRMQETDRQMQETDRRMQETDRQMQETDRRMQETDRQMQETDRYIKETDRQIRQLKDLFSNKWGQLVESLVSGCLLKILQDRNIQVTAIFPNIKTQYTNSQGLVKSCEIDIMARNGHEVVAVEVKSTLGVKEVQHFLEVLRQFPLFFPEYKGRKIYGAMSYLKLYQEADLYAMRRGLFVIKATGDSAQIVNDRDFKPVDFSSS